MGLNVAIAVYFCSKGVPTICRSCCESCCVFLVKRSSHSSWLMLWILLYISAQREFPVFVDHAVNLAVCFLSKGVPTVCRSCCEACCVFLLKGSFHCLWHVLCVLLYISAQREFLLFVDHMNIAVYFCSKGDPTVCRLCCESCCIFLLKGSSHCLWIMWILLYISAQKEIPLFVDRVVNPAVYLCSEGVPTVLRSCCE